MLARGVMIHARARERRLPDHAAGRAPSAFMRGMHLASKYTGVAQGGEEGRKCTETGTAEDGVANIMADRKRPRMLWNQLLR
jgi:hypothetical protein